MDVFINILLWILLTLIKIILTLFLTKLSKENKQVFFLGDFSIDLLNYNDHQPTNEFLDSLASNSFLPYILQPTRLTSHSKTLIDNIFSNVISHEVISNLWWWKNIWFSKVFIFQAMVLHTLTNQVEISIFNNYFASFAEKKVIINYTHTNIFWFPKR